MFRVRTLIYVFRNVFLVFEVFFWLILEHYYCCPLSNDVSNRFASILSNYFDLTFKFMILTKTLKAYGFRIRIIVEFHNCLIHNAVSV